MFHLIPITEQNRKGTSELLQNRPPTKQKNQFNKFVNAPSVTKKNWLSIKNEHSFDFTLPSFLLFVQELCVVIIIKKNRRQ